MFKNQNNTGRRKNLILLSTSILDLKKIEQN